MVILLSYFKIKVHVLYDKKTGKQTNYACLLFPNLLLVLIINLCRLSVFLQGLIKHVRKENYYCRNSRAFWIWKNDNRQGSSRPLRRRKLYHYFIGQLL